MSARRAIAVGAFVFGLGLAGWALVPGLPGFGRAGGAGTGVSDRAIAALFGAGLAWLGAMRLWLSGGGR